MQIVKELSKSIIKHADRNAFYIDDIFYTYADLAKSISRIRKSIQLNIPDSEKNIGLITNIDLETYASIFALWFEGKAYVPIAPEEPIERIDSVINQIGIKTFLDSSTNALLPQYYTIQTKKLPDAELNLNPKIVSDNNLVVILFTSGSTGIPKGVPLTIANLTAFLDAFFQENFKFDKNDRFLQMFELTFDFSILMYLIPLLFGSAIYTVPKNTIKFSYIIDLFEDHKLTVISSTPTLILYLRSFYNELYIESAKLCILGGEALALDLVEAWSQCVPNSKILNIYGPSEFTIFCSYHQFKRKAENFSYNNVLTIGKKLKSCEIIICDENHNVLGPNRKGEMCLGGPQLTPGYWNDEDKNKKSFFYIEYKGKLTRFYKTGDLCYVDQDGNFMYIGRIDFQTKIKGYRVELTEVEFHAKKLLDKINVVAVGYSNQLGETELGMVIDAENYDITELKNYLKTKVPFYMIPSKIRLMKELPLSKNGKIDRKLLTRYFNET